MDFITFYKRNGVRNITGLMDPKVVNNNELIYPKNVILHWTNISDIDVLINNKYSYLKNAKNSVVNTIVEYVNLDIQGKVTLKPFSISELVKKLKNNEPTFKFYPPNTSKIKLSSTKLLIFNYGMLNSKYRYAIDPLNDYYKFYNNFKTELLFTTSGKTGKVRHNIVLIDLPPDLPTILEFKKYEDKNTRMMLKSFFTYKHLIILELWRLLVGKESIFDIIPEHDYENITLMFNSNGYSNFLNMKTLLSLAEHKKDVVTKLNKLPTEKLIKLFYVFINKLIKATEVAVIDNSFKGTSKISDTIVVDNDIEVDETKDISMLDEVTNDYNMDDIDDIVADIDIDKVITDEDEYSSIDNILKEKPSIKEENIKNIKKLLDSKLISKAKYDTLIADLENQDSIKVEIDGKLIEVKELLEPADIAIDEDSIKLPDDKSVIDKSMLRDTLSVYDKKYIDEVYYKDLTKMIFGIQAANLLITDYNINTKESILGKDELHTFTIKALDGTVSKVSISLPKINEDGTYINNGNRYRLRKSKIDIPMKKIKFNRVALNTYYGKLNVLKSEVKRLDAGYWFRTQLIKKSLDNKDYKNLITLDNIKEDRELPLAYTKLARYVKSFNYKNMVFTFDYDNRESVFKDSGIGGSFKDLERNGIFIGYKDKTPMTIDDKGYITIGDVKTTIYDILDIDHMKEPIEYASLKIYKNSYPVGLLLSYYLGLDRLLKLLNVKYEIVNSKDRVPVSTDSYIIKFKDKKIIIDRDFGLGDIILSGLISLVNNTKHINYNVMNDKNSITTLFSNMEIPILYVNEIKLLEDLYIDPISAEVLESMNEPTTFKGVLIRSCELLLDDNYKNPNDISGMLIKGYEKLPGLLYNELIRAIKQHANKSIFSKSKITIPPHAIVSKLASESANVLVDDLNPIATIKQREDVVKTGFQGRSKETFTKETRTVDASEIGIISEATKDSSDVGISEYLTANPKIKNLRGIPDKFDFNKDGYTSILSTAGALSVGDIYDDPKRANFSNIMSAHIIPIPNSEAPYVRTGYENVIANRCDPKYVVTAIGDGVVDSVSKSAVTVRYKDGKSVKYKILKWTSKAESSSTYIHQQVSNVKKGDKVVAGDVLIYDPAFFEVDIFNTRRVIYKSAVPMSIALMEELGTYEDSCVISKKATNKLKVKVTKIKSVIIDISDEIDGLVKIGDKIKAGDNLFTIVDYSVAKLKGINEKTLELLKELKNSAIPSKYNGVIEDIIIYYNTTEDSEISESLKRAISESDARLMSKVGYTGKVDSSYSINGKRLLDDKLEIKVYITIEETMGTGDKAIISNQLKTTVGHVLDETITAVDSGDEIDLLFSLVSINARIVNSFSMISTTGKLLEIIGKKAVDIYES